MEKQVLYCECCASYYVTDAVNDQGYCDDCAAYMEIDVDRIMQDIDTTCKRQINDDVFYA